MTALDTLPVSECFGPTLQGEGPAAGRPAWFLRLIGCNLSCAWCDTPYTWDQSRFDLAAETTHMTAGEIADRLAGPGILVVTGGEPLRHQHRPAWLDLFDLMDGQDRAVHIETNGTIQPTDDTLGMADLIVVSPKLPNAGGHRGHQDPALADRWAQVAPHLPSVVMKVVCRDADDVAAAAALAERHGFPADRTWVMPEGTTPAALAVTWPRVAAAAAKAGVNACHRLHTLAWGTERGH